jgi:glycine betaine catabolism B
VVPEAPDAVTLHLRLTEPEPFRPGQHFILRVPLDGRPPAQRTFSPGSSPYPDPATLDITVREDPTGLVSPVLVRRVPVGATLEVEGPYGVFTWTEDDGGPIWMVAGGSGIAPLSSILRYVAAKGLEVPARLLYSSSDAEHAIYRHLLDGLAVRHRWLSLAHSFTADAEDTRAQFHRRIDTAMLEEFFGAGLRTGTLYVCGPPGLVANVRASADELGVPEAQVLSEEWE